MFDINKDMTKKIVEFPKHKIKRDRLEANRSSLSAHLARQDRFVEELTKMYSDRIISKLDYHGFDVDTDQFVEDYSLMCESLKSCLLRSLGRPHPLQKVQHKLLEMLEEEESKEL